jgi:hypothetical protein
MKLIMEFNLPTEMDIFNHYHNVPNIVKCLAEIRQLIAARHDNAKAIGDNKIAEEYMSILDIIQSYLTYYRIPSSIDPRGYKSIFDNK